MYMKPLARTYRGLATSEDFAIVRRRTIAESLSVAYRHHVLMIAGIFLDKLPSSENNDKLETVCL